jgi:membrane-associated protein
MGSIAWVSIFGILGALIGSNVWVEKNLDKMVIIIVVVSLLPMIFEAVRAKLKKKEAVVSSTPPEGED